MSTLSASQSKIEGPARLLNQLGWLAAQAMLWLFMATVVFPMLWTVFASLKTSPEIFNDPWGLPEIPQLPRRAAQPCSTQVPS